MAAIARYLFDEAASGTTPTTVADSSGNGNNLAITYDTDLAWGTIAGGNALIFGGTADTDANDEKVQLTLGGSALGTALSGATTFGLIFHGEISGGFSGYGGTKALTITDTTTTGRAGFFSLVPVAGSGLRIYFNEVITGGAYMTFPDPTALGVNLIVVNVDTTQATAADRIKVYYDGALQAGSGSIPQNYALPTFTTDHALVIGNDHYGDRNMSGSVAYVEFSDAPYIADDIATIQTALTADNDSNWLDENPAILNIDTDNSVAQGQTGITAALQHMTGSGTLTSLDLNGTAITAYSYTADANEITGVTIPPGATSGTLTATFQNVTITLEGVTVRAPTLVSFNSGQAVAQGQSDVQFTFSDPGIIQTVDSGTLNGVAVSNIRYTAGQTTGLLDTDGATPVGSNLDLVLNISVAD